MNKLRLDIQSGAMASCERKPVNASTTRHPSRVHLTPRAGKSNFGSSLSDTEREPQKTTSDASDVSLRDFDFEEIFIFDEPQKKLTSVVEVSIPAWERDWSNFSFSYYATGVAARNEMSKYEGATTRVIYMRNKSNTGDR